MNILVTGALGAVGNPLVQLLRSKGHDVWMADLPHNHDEQYLRADVGRFPQISAAVERVRPELVYHLGAEFGRFNGEDFYETLWQANAIGTKNVLRLQERHRFRMVFFSSSEIYGDWQGPMTEDVPEKHPIRQLNDYAISKWANEMQVMNSAERHGTETVRVRLFNTYGPGERYSNYRSVVCLFTYRSLKGMPYTVYAKHTRTLTYIDDCVESLAAISERFRPGDVYNIAGDEAVDMKTLSDMILERTGGDPKLVRVVDVEPHNTLHKKTSNARAKAELGLRLGTPLPAGLDRTVAWMRQTYGF